MLRRGPPLHSSTAMEPEELAKIVQNADDLSPETVAAAYEELAAQHEQAGTDTGERMAQLLHANATMLRGRAIVDELEMSATINGEPASVYRSHEEAIAKLDLSAHAERCEEIANNPPAGIEPETVSQFRAEAKAARSLLRQRVADRVAAAIPIYITARTAAPRARGRRERHVARSTSSGDSGDSSSGESDPPPLARLVRAFRRARVRFERVGDGSVGVRRVFRPGQRPRGGR